jgi:hypothetical protein
VSVLPNKALQLTSAGGRPSASLWRLQLNAGTLGGRTRSDVVFVLDDPLAGGPGTEPRCSLV